MKISKRILSISTTVVLLTCILCGCSGGDSGDISSLSKKDIIVRYNSLMNSYSELSTKNEELQATLESLTLDGTVQPAISTVGDGTGRFTFNSVDSKIIFPTTFVYPGSSSIVPDGQINIISGVSVKPASTWITRINGSALELEQSTNGISGTIKVNKLENVVPVDQLEDEVLKPWFDQVAYTTVNYSDVFIGTASAGKQAETPILIDSENAYLICGMVASGNFTVTYIFVYRGSQDQTKTELIKTVLNSINISGQQVTVQN